MTKENDFVLVYNEQTGKYEWAWTGIEKGDTVILLEDMKHPHFEQGELYLVEDINDEGEIGLLQEDDSILYMPENYVEKEAFMQGHQRTSNSSGNYDDYASTFWGGNYSYGRKGGYWNCHRGNTKIATLTSVTRGSLFLGGWSREAKEGRGMAVIDLTAKGPIGTHSDNWYDIKVKDFDVPQWSDVFYEHLADLIYHELSENKDMLIACQGGHGRSGTIATIMAIILNGYNDIHIIDDRVLVENPVKWMRTIHCGQAIETIAQENLVWEKALTYLEQTDTLLDNSKRYPKKPKSKKKKTEKKGGKKEDDKTQCPICLELYDTYYEAVMCCQTKGSSKRCPVCFEKTESTRHSYYHCLDYQMIKE